MAIDNKAFVEEGTPRYLASGDPELAAYYPAWLDNIADDATVEGSMLDGAVQGPEGVQAIVSAIGRFTATRRSSTSRADGATTEARGQHRPVAG